ncbi:Sulfotransferase [Ferriphaselus amnicola]|uniref:Sulfotransferase n=1 Tax=Ferriphaselus amnicola TaxID=1188319 RepID=A0A2Z6G9T4_9PROT|nr:sulfotransferase [Ferriphaselus amnicola]BBE50260.1 Sulfotransferase [Ferriphaselus amnicola]
MVAQIDSTYIMARPTKLYSRLLSYALFEGRPLTTKGRWINPLVFALFGLAKHLPVLRKVREPVFILGTGRSGTTILGIVLSMHHDVAFLNEPKAIWHAIYSGEDLIGNYTQEAAHYRLGAADATDIRLKWIQRIYGIYLAVTFSRRLVDKYPELIFRVPFVRALFPDAKFLFLMRNGFDTCHSIESWSGRLGDQVNGEVHDWWGVNQRKWKLLVEQIVPAHPDLAPHQAEIARFTKQTDMAAVEWIVTMREGLALMESDPSAVMGVRFEDLSGEPESTLGKLCEFLNLPKDKVFLGYGIKTLHPVREVKPFTLHPLIVNAFNETMRKLNYVQ